MSVKIIEEPVDNTTKYRIRCKDQKCRKILEYTKADIKSGAISIGGAGTENFMLE